MVARGTSSFKVLSWNYSKGEKPIQLITLEPSDEVPQIDKVTLTLYDPYSLAEDLIGSHIFDDFNDENEKYRIEIMSGNANVQTVLAGEDTPDLFFSLFSEDISRLYSKGYLTDLFLLMNENSIIQPDDICEPVLKKFSVDGKLYAIPKYIALSTLMVKKEQVPYSEGWTVDEFLSWLEDNPVVSTLGLEKGKILDFCLQGSMESFVMPDTHSADFDDGRFADILERIGKMKYPNKVETILTDISKKDTILLDEYLQQISLLLLNEYKYGGEIINLGYPNENGSGKALIDSTTNIAILEKSKNKEGAFEFLEYCITYPMDELKAMKAELLGGVPEGTLWPLKSMWALESELAVRDKHWLTGINDYYEVKESDIEKVQNIIDNAIAEPYEYYLIRNIISEECESFFAGQKSAKDVCSIIQSKVAIFLSEME